MARTTTWKARPKKARSKHASLEYLRYLINKLDPLSPISISPLLFYQRQQHPHTNDITTCTMSTHCVACNAIEIGTLEQTIVAYAVGKMYESSQ
jgi:hypothetical protein